MYPASRVIVLGCFIFLVSCAPFTTSDFRETDKLHRNTGVVIAVIGSNNADLAVSLAKDGRKTASISMKGGYKRDDRFYRLAVMEVESGFTSFDTITLNNKYLRIEDGARTWVEVKPLHVTFLGSLYVEVQQGEKTLKFATDMNSAGIMPVIKEHLPWLLERYPLNDHPRIKNTSGPQY